MILPQWIRGVKFRNYFFLFILFFYLIYNIYFLFIFFFERKKYIFLFLKIKINKFHIFNKYIYSKVNLDFFF